MPVSQRRPLRCSCIPQRGKRHQESACSHQHCSATLRAFVQQFGFWDVPVSLLREEEARTRGRIPEAVLEYNPGEFKAPHKCKIPHKYRQHHSPKRNTLYPCCCSHPDPPPQHQQTPSFMCRQGPRARSCAELPGAPPALAVTVGQKVTEFLSTASYPPFHTNKAVKPITDTCTVRDAPKSNTITVQLSGCRSEEPQHMLLP